MTIVSKLAIVGMSCRFPKAKSLEQYWALLKAGKNAIEYIDNQHFSTRPYYHPNNKKKGRSYTFSAGILNDINRFDAAFFNISHREAMQMDPQQRILLELTWEAFEDAGYTSPQLAKSRTGVFIAISGTDYKDRIIDDLGAADIHSMTGNTHSISANRISYYFDFIGPSMAIDTACSSSLVALHQACLSIQSGESSTAVIGGINMLLHPLAFVGFSKASMLSVNGKCMAFSDEADGYVRSEGGAVLVIKPLEQAEKDGDNIHAVILSSGVNCDGATSSLTVPDAKQQQLLLEEVYNKAHVTPNEVHYIEAHGTGTKVGDPIEATALAMALAKRREHNNPLLIGSVKTNIGHLETASGLAGLIKIVLAIKHKAIPKSLHADCLNKNIPFDDYNLQVNRTYQDLSHIHEKLIMGVNSFGFGGTNAHVIIKEYPTPVSLPNQKNTSPPLIISAKNVQALQDLAYQYSCLIAKNTYPYYDIAWSAYHHRTWHNNRMLFAGTPVEIEQNLLAFSKKSTYENCLKMQTSTQKSKLVFVFSGNASQWQGMGQAFYAHNAVFRKTMITIDKLWQTHGGTSLLSAFAQPDCIIDLELTEVAQPLLLMIQIGIVCVLKDDGIKPDAVVGYSIGEVAAAWAAQMITLEDAVWIVYERSQAQSKTKGSGKMVAVNLSPQQAQEKINNLQLTKEIEIAGINSPTSVTLTGALPALEKLKSSLGKVFYRLLDLDYAFHSAQMDNLQSGIKSKLNALKTTQGKVLFVSTVTGNATNQSVNADYWWENIRQPVQFLKAINYLIDKQFETYLEIGPRPILKTYIHKILKQRNSIGNVISTLSPNDKNKTSLEAVIYQLMLSKAPINKEKFFPDQGLQIKLPLYPWQHEEHWYQKTTKAYDFANRKHQHPLLGYRLKETAYTWENQLDIHLIPYLQDHVVDQLTVFPASAYIEMAIAASKILIPSNRFVIEQLEIIHPCILEEHHLKELQLILHPQDRYFRIISRNLSSDEKWMTNVTGQIIEKNWPRENNTTINVHALIAESHCSFSADFHYPLMNKLQLNYGPTFQCIKKVWLNNKKHQTVIAELRNPFNSDTDLNHYYLHPCLLDSCLQVSMYFFLNEVSHNIKNALIPIQFAQLSLYHKSEINYVRATLIKQSKRSVVINFILFDKTQKQVAELKGCRFRSINLIKQKTTDLANYYFKAQLSPRLDTLSTSFLSQHPLSNEAIAGLIEKKIIAQNTSHRNLFINNTRLLIDRLVVAYIFEALQAFGLDCFYLEDFILKTGVLKKHHNLLQKLLSILKDEGLLVFEQNQWIFTQSPLNISAQNIWQTILIENPYILPELLLVGRCGTHLKSILLGNIQPSSLLNPFNSSIQEQWLDNSLTFQVIQSALVNTIDILIENWPKDKRFRIAIFGSKNATWLHSLIHHLKKINFDLLLLEQDEYTTTFINKYQQKIPHINAFDLQIDVEKLSNLTSFSEGFFDIILMNHCLYEASDLNAILYYLNTKLALRGKLLIAELQPDYFSDITLGLLDNWWQYEETNNNTYSRLLNSNQWESLLVKNNFQNVTTLFEPEDKTQTGPALYIATANIKKEVSEQTPLRKKNETWLIFSDASEDAYELANRLGEALLNDQMQYCLLLTAETEISHCQYQADLGYYLLNAERAEQFVQFWSQLQKQCIKIDKIVYLVGFSNTTDTIKTAMNRQCLIALSLIQSIKAAKLAQSPQLNLITLASAAVSSQSEFKSYPHQAMLWGLGRTIMNEHKELSCRLIDWHDTYDIDTISQALYWEIKTETAETEVMLNRHSRHVTRMDIIKFDHPKKHTDTYLNLYSPGKFDNLYWEVLPAHSLNNDEIEIKPLASGLNFRDVIYVTGKLADEAIENGFFGAGLGLEFAGRITQLGSSIKNFNIGDPVFGFAPACFSSRIITKPSTLALMPKSWSFEAAATIPTTFFTAYYALYYLGQLKKGETILIHGASGGVGLAAIQIAQYLKLKIFATAGTDEKRDYITMLGVEHVMNSRNLKFADEIMEKTHGRGVDAILNNIAGEAIKRNLAILKPFGRLLEIGKVDFYQDSQIGLRPFRNNISYFGIDVDQLLIEKADLANKLFKQLMQLFKEGILNPLPYRQFPASLIENAFRYMNQSRHIGKVVISFAEGYPIPQKILAEKKLFHVRKKSTYLITGGTQGLGLKTAEWLIKKGVESLVLISRRGQLEDQYLASENNIMTSGVHIQVLACDVTNFSAVKKIISDIEQSKYPLAGIIHAAMVLKDSLLNNMTALQFNEVIAPKAIGAWNLHEATEQINLDCFLMYSSATTFLGNPGQANYIAANLYLQALVNYRKQQGKKATFIAWGAIGDVGYLSRNTSIKQSFEKRFGTKAVTFNSAVAQMESLLMQNDYQGYAPIELNWNTLRKLMPSVASPKYEILFDSKYQVNDENIREQIKMMNEEELLSFIKTLLQKKLADILRLPKKMVDTSKPLNTLGLDSLMSMELINDIEDILDIDIPIMYINSGANIEKLSNRIVNKVMTKTPIEEQTNEEILEHVRIQQGSNISTAEKNMIKMKINNGSA